MNTLNDSTLDRRGRMVQLALTSGLALLVLAALLWGFQGVTPARADPGTLYVDGAGGSDTGDCQGAASACRTIGYAITQAGAGDVIQVAEGVYTESLLVDVSVTLKGGYEPISWTRNFRQHGSTIDGSGTITRSPVAIPTGDLDVALDGFRITGGNVSTGNGGGVQIWSDGSVEIANAMIVGNAARWYGGGIAVQSAVTLTMRNVVVADNQAGESTPPGNGGGIYLQGGAQATLIDVRIHDNSAGAQGGGLQAHGPDTMVVISDSQIYSNTAYGGDGGGIAAYGPLTLTMRNVAVADNQGGGTGTFSAGGGIYMRDGVEATLTDVRLHGNAAEEAGGLRVDDPTTTAVVSGSWIYSNTARNGAGGGISVNQGELHLSDSSVGANGAPEGEAGGIHIADGGSAQVMDATIADNQTRDHGGAISALGATASLTNVLMTGNETSSGNANVLAVNDSQVTIVNSTIADNNPQAAQAVLLWSGHLTVTNTILSNNALNLQGDPPCPSCFTVTYSDVEGGWAGVGNIDADPRFVDATSGDYALRATSPCVDAGTPLGAPAADIDGTPRDDAPDIGAYEWTGFRILLPLVVRDAM